VACALISLQRTACGEAAQAIDYGFPTGVWMGNKLDGQGARRAAGGAERPAAVYGRIGACALALGTILGAAAPAWASGITLGRFGGVYGHPNADGGLAMYWNPARISVRPGWFATVDATLVRRTASYDRVTDIEGPGVAETNTGRATIGTTAILPYIALGGTVDLNRVRLGFAVGGHPGFGGTAAWDKNYDTPSEYPGGVDGPQRWSGITSSFILLHGVAATSMTLVDHGLSFGAALTVATADVSTIRARNVNRTEQPLDERGRIQEGRVAYEGSGTALALNVGASWDSDVVTVSAHYRSGYNLALEGEARQAYGTQPPIRGGANLDFPTPHVFLTAVTLRFGDFEITGMTDYALWSRMEANRIFAVNDPPDLLLEIPRNLVDTLSVRAMLGYNVNSRLNLTGMLGIDPSAVPEETMDASLSDAFKVQIGLGLRADINPHFRIHTSYVHDIYSPVIVRDSIHEPRTNGTYRDSRGWLNLSLEGRL
jgi:long-subunit fatty acid transport protein